MSWQMDFQCGGLVPMGGGYITRLYSLSKLSNTNKQGFATALAAN